MPSEPTPANLWKRLADDARGLPEQLIHALQHNGRATYNELATELGAPRNLVSSTVRRLLQTGQIRIVATAAHGATGHHVLAHVALRCAPNAEDAIGHLMDQEDIPWSLRSQAPTTSSSKSGRPPWRRCTARCAESDRTPASARQP
ncbi:Lrp/AsnC family transcriptional regulator [Nesterenkonia pannonica]|uniref:Lrp/AsnC family transcriptional regulator n=1 Tax=Nesterenkonia pannonica TaxID=1548602 RepID=UPI002164F013|nr:Lrp/AsnC family transcriptional regulator [Nesterenkonia pannonica]